MGALRAPHLSQSSASRVQGARAAVPVKLHVLPKAWRSLGQRSFVSQSTRSQPTSSSNASCGTTSSSSQDLHPVTAQRHGAPFQPKPWLRALAIMVAVVALHSLVLTPVGHAIAAAAGSASAATAGSPLQTLLSWFLHLDKHMAAIIEQHGRTTYAILFAIVFAETGLVLTPFLPGDSLLFAAGAFAGMGRLDVATLVVVFLVSAILGDAVNYAVGNKLGGWAVNKGLVKQEYVAKTEAFYSKYGGKTVVLARFVPIIRTFAPFVAGVGSMPYSQFATYNVLGAVIWVALFVGGGFFFGAVPFVQKNFTLVVLAIVAISVVPVVLELMAAQREGKQQH